MITEVQQTTTTAESGSVPEAAAPDAKAPETPAAPPPPSPTKSFAAAARKEKDLQRKREQLKAAEDALAKQQADLAQKLKEIEERYAKPENPLKALERFGWNYKDATDFALNDGQPTPEQIALATREELAAFKAQQVQEKKAAEEAAAKAKVEAEENTVKAFKGQIADFVKTQSAEYELISLHDAHEMIYDVIEEAYNKTGKVLSIKEGADLLEGYFKELAEKALGTRHFKAASKASPEKQPANPGQEQAQPSRTLSQSTTPTTPTLVRSQRVEDDRMARAMAALERKGA
jgi:hypothetical protein